MTLLLWSRATNKVVLTRDAERVILRDGEQVVPLRHKAFEAGRLMGEGRVQCVSPLVHAANRARYCDILRRVGPPGYGSTGSLFRYRQTPLGCVKEFGVRYGRQKSHRFRYSRNSKKMAIS